MKNQRLAKAVQLNRLTTKRGILERLFTLNFSGLVYPQIWEDPEVDMAALRLGANSRLVTIASGGCNIMTYLTARPAQVAAVDLNPAQIALTRLKLAAAKHLPDYETFFKFFGHADDRENPKRYRQYIRPHLDEPTRKYWDAPRTFRGRRISLFAHNIYRFGNLGRFIGTVHFLARAGGSNPRRLVSARSMEEQRRLFDETLAPLFETRLVRWLCSLPVSLYGLGIPPAQYVHLRGASPVGEVSAVMRERLERLACGFPIEDNYFAWQAFNRRFDHENRRAVPPYLRPEHFDTIRDEVDRVSVQQTTVTEFLHSQPDDRFNSYVLLDAQDWMTETQLADLWREITRTCQPGGRAIFRTAGRHSILEDVLPPEIRSQWHYDPEEGEAWLAKDRSSIYGGFHVYEHRP